MAPTRALIIVESPAKARTIQKILGGSYDVTSSMGHVRDLPRSKMGVDIEHDFAPEYIVIMKRRKAVKDLQALAAGHHEIYLATDPDREGEAISWHLAAILNEPPKPKAKRRTKKQIAEAAAAAATPEAAAPPKAAAPAPSPSSYVPPALRRVTFHEITPSAIREAFKHPAIIDVNKVNAQQARRILDRLVGYSLSPLLWRKVGRGLSAGRVQSVAVKLIVEREREIEAFTPQEYWTIDAKLAQQPPESPTFLARVDQIHGQKAAVPTRSQAEEIAAQLRGASCAVDGLDQREQRNRPKPPFTTSTLQQEAFYQLRFSAANTMRIAQQLYEGVELGDEGATGLITYMRTDSVNIAKEALAAVRGLIGERFGATFVPEEPRFYKSKKSAQEAHEAIRPTSVLRHPDQVKPFLTEEQDQLYRLIWARFVASQMADAILQLTTATIAAGSYTLKATGRVTLFEGFTAVYRDIEEEDEKDEEGLREGELPPLQQGEPLRLLECLPGQHFTKPPRRYTDASLVKTLEENGIGRPSTYAPTIQTIVSRDYVRRQGGSFVPTPLGRLVTDLLQAHFPTILDIEFTAAMEEHLDEVEEGRAAWVQVVRDFYDPFSKTLTVAQEEMKNIKLEVTPTGQLCEQCGKPLVIKWGRKGQFISCSGWPECKNAKPLTTGVKCTEPGCEGEFVERRGRGGRFFYGCSRYPACTCTTRKLPSADAPAENGGEETVADV